MKKLILFLGAILFVFACEKEEIISGGSEAETSIDFRAAKDKVTICHYTGSGRVRVLDVSESAVQAHLDHGDMLVDADGDGYTAPASCTGSKNDCNDNDPNVHPGAMEICGNHIDDNCNGQVDEDCDEDLSYKTIVINGKTWLAENLDIEVPGSWCYDNDLDNCTEYGRLYTWEAAKAACAQLGDGWRLPTKAEWDAMMEKFWMEWIEDQVENFGDDYYENYEMYHGYEGFAAYEALIEGGKSGLDLILAGYLANKNFYGLGTFGIYWSGTDNYENAGHPWSYSFSDYEMNGDDTSKWFGSSCRCIQD